MYRAALRGILSELLRENRLIVVDNLVDGAAENP